MGLSNPIYRKQNSFTDIRYRRSANELIPRIEKLRGNLDALTLIPTKGISRIKNLGLTYRLRTT